MANWGISHQACQEEFHNIADLAKEAKGFLRVDQGGLPALRVKKL